MRKNLLQRLQERLPWLAESNRGKRDVSLRTFGKLPLSADFDVTVGCDGPGGWLVGWLESGRKKYSEHSNTIPPKVRFVLSPQDSSHSVVGTMIDSRDRAGRHYPFAVFIAIEKATIRSALPALTHWLFDVWESIDVAMDTITQIRDLESFKAFCSNRALTVPEASKDVLANYSEEWLNSKTEAWIPQTLWIPSQLAKTVFIKKFRNSLSVIPERPLAIRMPLSRSISKEAQIDFWCDALLRAGGEKEPPTLLIFFSDKTRDPDSFCLLSRPTEPIDYVLLTGGAQSSVFVEDLASVPKPLPEIYDDSVEKWLTDHRTLGAVLESVKGKESD